MKIYHACIAQNSRILARCLSGVRCSEVVMADEKCGREDEAGDVPKIVMALRTGMQLHRKLATASSLTFTTTSSLHILSCSTLTLRSDQATAILHDGCAARTHSHRISFAGY